METAATVLLWLLVLIVGLPVLVLVGIGCLFLCALFEDRIKAAWRWIRRA